MKYAVSLDDGSEREGHRTPAEEVTWNAIASCLGACTNGPYDRCRYIGRRRRHSFTGRFPQISPQRSYFVHGQRCTRIPEALTDRQYKKFLQGEDISSGLLLKATWRARTLR